MAKKPVVKTIHHMDIAASLEAQNNAVMFKRGEALAKEIVRWCNLGAVGA